MWVILKRQCSAVWYSTEEASGRVVLERPAHVERVAPSVLELIDDARTGPPERGVQRYDVQGDPVLVASFDKGVVAVLVRNGANVMTAQAALRRWPGEAMVKAANEGFERDVQTARVSASKALLDDGDEPQGLEESTDRVDYSTLEIDSFADEVVFSSDQRDEHNHADDQTRVMACTWIQVVEHFGRISEALQTTVEGLDPYAVFQRVASPLGSYLKVQEGDFVSGRPSARVGRADAEVVDGVYRDWIRESGRVTGFDFVDALPTVDATPWRGLLTERDAPVEEVAFSI